MPSWIAPTSKAMSTAAWTRSSCGVDAADGAQEGDRDGVGRAVDELARGVEQRADRGHHDGACRGRTARAARRSWRRPSPAGRRRRRRTVRRPGRRAGARRRSAAALRARECAGRGPPDRRRWKPPSTSPSAGRAERGYHIPGSANRVGRQASARRSRAISASRSAAGRERCRSARGRTQMGWRGSGSSAWRGMRCQCTWVRKLPRHA